MPRPLYSRGVSKHSDRVGNSDRPCGRLDVDRVDEFGDTVNSLRSFRTSRTITVHLPVISIAVICYASEDVYPFCYRGLGSSARVVIG